jgi:hypothetical protein
MESFEGMPHMKEPEEPTGPKEFSRASLELSGDNAHPQSLRTFQSDLADTIKSGEGSVVSIAMAENRKRERAQENINPASRTNILYVIGGITLVVIALGLIGYGIYQKIPKVVPLSETSSTLPSVIKADSTQTLNITGLSRDNISDQIGRMYSGATPTLNTVQRILPFTQQPNSPQHVVTTQELFTSIESSIPPQLLRSLDPTYTLGVFAYNGNGLFLAFKTDSYTTAFAGMLDWEKNMFDEFYKVFAIPTAGEPGLFTSAFKDRVIKNQDARALLDSKGNVVLYYTFIGEDKSTIIIADKEQTLTEVLNRLTANDLKH